MACGKGGDLPKWKEAGIGAYCGIDIAPESVRTDGRLRYNTGRFTFPAALFVADCFEAPLAPALLPRGPFDVISCQFALHYAFGSEARVRRALENISSLLRTGGVFLGTTADADVLVRKLRASHGLRFGNDVFGCAFHASLGSKTFEGRAPFGLEYRFTLADAVDDVAEYLVHKPTLERLAAEYGLRLVLWQNFHQFVHARLRVPEDRQLWVSRGLGGVLDDATGAAQPPGCALSADEWEVAHLYAVYAFAKARRAVLLLACAPCLRCCPADAHARRRARRARRRSSWRRGRRQRATRRARGCGTSTAAPSKPSTPRASWRRRRSSKRAASARNNKNNGTITNNSNRGLLRVITLPAATPAPAPRPRRARCRRRRPSRRRAGRRGG